MTSQLAQNHRCDLDLDPISTSNSLKDVIDWLSLGDYVVIHYGSVYGRFFHKECSRKVDMTNTEIDNFLGNCRVIYVNVSSLPGLLDDGEWEWYIKDKGHHECTCSLTERTSDPNHLPHGYHLTLGY